MADDSKPQVPFSRHTTLCCDFCGTSRAKAELLFLSSRSATEPAICAECVDTMGQVLHAARIETFADRPKPDMQALAAQAAEANWRFAQHDEVKGRPPAIKTKEQLAAWYVAHWQAHPEHAPPGLRVEHIAKTYTLA